MAEVLVFYAPDVGEDASGITAADILLPACKIG
jgi:hypothetical protein